MRIRDPGWKNSDPGWKNFGSGINIRVPQHCSFCIFLRQLQPLHWSLPLFLVVDSFNLLQFFINYMQSLISTVQYTMKSPHQHDKKLLFFRTSDESFVELSRGAQSGGEKSVSTAVYMMALQASGSGPIFHSEISFPRVTFCDFSNPVLWVSPAQSKYLRYLQHQSVSPLVGSLKKS
jgi:hypothetical protein